jgi:hypothetical protein
MLNVKQTASLVAGLALFYASFAVAAPQCQAAEAMMESNTAVSGNMQGANTEATPSLWSRMFGRDGGMSQKTSMSNEMSSNGSQSGMMNAQPAKCGTMGMNHQGMMSQGGYGQMDQMEHQKHFEDLAQEWKTTIKLTPDQQKKLMDLETEYKMETDAMEMNVAKLKQDMMMSLGAQNLDEAQLNTKIDVLSDAKRDLMKKRVNFYFEVEDFLTKDQVMKSREFWANHMADASKKMPSMGVKSDMNTMPMMKKSMVKESSVNLGFESQQLPMNSTFKK